MTEILAPTPTGARPGDADPRTTADSGTRPETGPRSKTTDARPRTTEVGPPPPAGRPSPGRVVGLRCRACKAAVPVAPEYVCARCFGPLEPAYDDAAIRATLSHEAIAARPPGIWRYLELLPLDEPPTRSLPVGSTPLQAADRLGARLGLDRLWLKNDSVNPTLSFKDRVVAVATARALGFGFDTVACASTGNLAGATAAAAAAAGLRAFVFVPADLEPAKIRQAAAYGATIVPVAGTYDRINRLSLEVADELGWAFLNVTLRPFYAEGSKTIAYEIAEQLGWRLPDVVVCPIASGSLFTKVAAGFGDLVRLGLVEDRPVRFIGAQPEGCAPVAAAWRTGADRPIPVAQPRTIVKSLAIGDPADGIHALALARESGGSIEAVSDDATAEAIRLLARTEGVFTETAGGVTIAALRQARERGLVRPDEEVVALVTGNGLKTPEAVADPATEALFVDGGIDPAKRIEPTLAAFERWLAAR
ncbi:MAG TPA: threonine synthase [Candidatus Limnocylindrales bacterium]|nr:threonine synthase [Candidatus Limnocylindrales bacterium]